jgi:type IX secretion system PorP/SprF family membrane protein
MKKIIFAGCLVLMAGFTKAQDIHFSQVLNNPLFVNPANVGGFDGYERAVINYRSQWASSGSPFKTMGASFDMPLLQKDAESAHLGIGGSFYSDKAGDSKFGVSMGQLSVGGIVPVTRTNFLSAAIQIGYAQRSANLNNVTWEQVEPIFVTYPSWGYMDLSSGIRFQHRSRSGFDQWNLYNGEIGIAAYHLTQPKNGNDVVYRRYVAHASGRIDLPQAYIGIIPFVTAFLQGPMQEINVGLMGRFRLSRGTKITGLLTESALSVGAQYRLNDALIPTLMFELGPFGLGVSYDYNTSTYKKVSRGNGGFEVALKFHDTKGATFRKRTNSRIY